MPLKYDEQKRESRCEICRCQFALASGSRSASIRGDKVCIDQLIQETHPGIISRSLIEVEEMKKRSVQSSSTNLIEKNRITNFFRRHEVDYQEKTREFPPFVAVSTIQATIIGLALAAFVKWWLAAAFAVSLFLLGNLCFLILLRRRILKMFDQSAIKLVAMTGLDVHDMNDAIQEEKKRFPKSAAIVHSQFLRLSPEIVREFEKGRDFIALLEELEKVPEL